MAKKDFNIDDSPAMQFVTENRGTFEKFATVSANVNNPSSTLEFLGQAADNTEPVTKPLEATQSDENQKSDTGITLTTRKRPEPRRRCMTIRIPESLHAKIVEKAASREVSMSEYIVEALTVIVDKVDV